MWRLKWDTQTSIRRRSLCTVLYHNLCCYIGPLLFLLLFLVLSLEIHVKKGICLCIYENCKECQAVIRNNLFYLQLTRYNILAYSEQDCIWKCANCLKCLNKSPVQSMRDDRNLPQNYLSVLHRLKQALSFLFGTV